LESTSPGIPSLSAMKSAIWKLLMLLGLVAGSLQVPTTEVAKGVHMPVLSIGTGGLEISDAATIVKNWLDLGGRGIDTAWIYRDQKEVAKAIVEAGVPRQDLFITSKIPGCLGVKAMVESDLAQLDTDYIDLLLIHFPQGGNCSVAWGILEDLHFEGKLKAIGVSNFQEKDLQAILTTARVTPAVNQIQLNVLEHDDKTIAFSKQHNITVEAYSPLGRAGHSGDIPDNEVVQALAQQHNVSTYQVAMRWIIQHGHVITFQSTSQAHQKADADIFSFELSEEEMARLDGLQGAEEQIMV